MKIISELAGQACPVGTENLADLGND